jgi:hypothetical protein
MTDLTPTRDRTSRRAFAAGLVLAASTLALPARSQTTAPVQHKLAPDATGPQTAIPAPRPGGDADVPGGSAKNGVIQPPATGPGRSVMTPREDGSTMPVIRPPGTSSQPGVEPK